MTENKIAQSRIHDLAGTVLGLFALIMLATSPWQVDTTGPEPFYKGPLLFPLILFSIMLAGALPSVWRLCRPLPGALWQLDGHAKPRATLALLVLLVLFIGGLQVLGLELSTWLFLTISLKIVHQDTRAKMLFFPAGVTLVLYLVFKVLLDIWFPEPLALEWIRDWIRAWIGMG